ncbi:hypothetical protein LptCag_0296 [Leptospirillum ferriphilum]|uniref:Uncharacterized protein n=1 Tax=Leptospirillum ferriphilum TaxID=178606 RepID=A0A094W9R5_9BACT|nr:hypothetical protein ABH19_09720 [Leptospirillum sp. Group II 'CF-1']KGA93260.1 hypothetical protein LptCag_0296 [Leptospirillum ferriphilum]OOH74363.1 hypothetical protein BOX24_01875 [Leptospirillum ferriphilum]
MPGGHLFRNNERHADSGKARFRLFAGKIPKGAPEKRVRLNVRQSLLSCRVPPFILFFRPGKFRRPFP